MQTLPDNWADIFAASYKVEYKLQIAGVEYESENMMGVPVITKPLLEKPTIGRVVSATLTVTIIPYSNVSIPKAARVHLYSRLTDADGNTTDWIPQGKYYVSSRSGKTNITLTCRDDMLKGGDTYLDKTTLDFPAQQVDIVTEIAELMDVEIDERTSLLEGTAYAVDEVSSDTLMTEILGFIAACNGGNFCMTEEGKLRLIPFASPGDPVQEIEQSYNDYTNTGDAITYTRVTLVDSGGTEYTEGDDSGSELYVECAYANQTVVARLGNTADGILYGAIYQPFTIDKVYLNPACELGDTIMIQTRSGSDLSVVLNSITANCNTGFTCQISAEIESESDDEYPYQTASEVAASRTVSTNKTYYGNTITRDAGFKSTLDNGAYGLFNADGITFVDENGKKCFYYDVDAKTFILDATLGANAVFTNMLYAESGAVSEITVDQLSTSKHIRKFLLQDTSDDCYILIKDYSIQFISATPAGLYNRLLTEDNVQIITEDNRFIDCEAGGTTDYEQATNRYGDLLYWEKDITNAVISDEGYPYIDDVQIFTTTEDTGYPVYIYVYEETVKAEYKFEEDTEEGEYAPVQIWGEGSGYGNNGKGRIQKTSDAFSIGYTTRTSTEESIEFNDDGWVDINKTRKPLSFNFSKIDDGEFTETIDGGDTATYKVGFDSAGRITKITDESGHITEVTW